MHLVTLTKQLGGDADSPDVPVGTQVAARTHTVNRYDENRPTDGTAVVSDQLTSTRVGAFVDGYPADGDVRTTANRYDWVKGLQTGTVTDPTGLNPVHSTSYDAQGRVIKTTLPKSNGSDAGARVTTYWSATGTGTCQGRPEWADLACTTGPAVKITGGGSQPDELPVSTTQYDRWGDPTIVTETANGTTRTTESTYDAAGRLTSAKVTGGTGAAVPPRTVTYDPVNGAAATVGNRTATVRRTSDALGRVISYDRPRPRRRRERVRLSRRPGQPVRPGRKVQAKYNKNSRSCSFWHGRCTIKLSRVRAWKASWNIIGGATAWGVSAALFGAASAGILAAVMGILAGVATWVAVNIQRVLSSFPNRGVKLTVWVYGRVSITKQ
ncbi:hypothetical protein J7F02_09720 [Streptomyces sp. ISL-112]|uniref:hypothetical protein n=1 Tax=unclassified Streptomyces TaxID=2593676 RepID=UPI001BECDFE3|nr:MULTISPECIES: hypothetical protein [unclassified Streptomyces]MBT2425947.1 hypothetical protein [Streptomyces sp. ISL-112]MBT2460930.1 hypothetical protein [Streptomyces sp. ISL-63]